jgi:hypothetical protein
MNNTNNDADDDKRVFYGTLISIIKILDEKI